MNLTRLASVSAIALIAGVSAPTLGDPHRAVDAYPNTLGNSAAASYATRYAANRAELARLGGSPVRAGTQAQVGRMWDGAGSKARTGRERAALFARWAAQRRRVLAFDPRGDGRMVQVYGDLAHADRVVVYVPGNAKTVDNFDAATAAEPKTAPGPVSADLYAEARSVRPSARTAVIAWLGYDPPENIDMVSVESARAMAGARSLTRLLRVLPHRARVSLVCHSYGTVVCGRAASRVPVANVVALASPGMDVPSARAVKGRVWAGRAADDLIRLTPHVRLGGLGHGADPMSPAFGARLIDTAGDHGHEGYFTPGSGSLREIAEIATGAPAATADR
ncbi:MAG TPA: alpha/beta hydrolase [Streptosporangiaceae bacterium]|jgi:hypothetical protein